MLFLLLLSCVVSGLVLGEETVFSPVPSATDANQYLAGTDDQYSLYHIKLNWYQAMQFCLQMNKRLGTFTSKAENYKLLNLIYKNVDDSLDVNYWTAGSDLGERGKYVWMSTGKAVSYSNWWPSEPNYYSWNGETEHCIDIRAEYDFFMNDNRCSVPQYIICEKNK